jgi:glycosyltransferase involved in cell wall biosynthesis
MMKISLIMATVNRLNEIYVLAESLERQSSRDFELIIADQNPDGFLDPVLQRIEEAKLAYKRIPTAKVGLSMARNHAFTHALSEIIGYPDDDCWYEEDVIEQVIRYFAENEDVDGIVGRWCEWDTSNETGYSLQLSKWKRFRVDIAGSSICLFMRKELIERASGFDEKLGVPQLFGAGEEIDLIMRCLEFGAKIQYVPNIRIHHPVKTYDNSSVDLQEIRKRSRGTGALYRKHNISWFVIFRGVLTTLARLLIPPYSFCRIQTCMITILGRLEGRVLWAEVQEQRKMQQEKSNAVRK